jgi:hypothetical protein
MIYNRHLAITVIAAIMVTAFFAMPADARAKKKSKYPADTATTQSLDGRNLGRARTCGFNTFVYDGLGVPEGPYCH